MSDEQENNVDTGWRKIAVIGAGHFSHDLYTSFLAPILPLLIQKFSLTYTLAGLLNIVRRLPSLLNPLIGSLAERTSLKWFVILSPSVTAVSMCLLGVAPAYWVLVLLLAVVGLSSAAFHVPLPLILARLSGSRTGTGMSFFQIGGELARAVGPVLITGAISLWSLRKIYRLIPIGIAMSVIFYFVLDDFAVSANDNKSTWQSIFETFNNHKKVFLAIFGVLLTKAFVASVLVTYLPTYMNQIRGSSLLWSGATLSVVQGAAMVGVLLTGYISDKVGRRKILFILTFGAPVFMVCFLFSPHWLLIPALVMVGLFGFTSTPVLLALIQELQADFPSVANGIYMTLNFMLTSLVILGVSKLSDFIGLADAFLVSSLLAFLGVPFLLLLPDI
ncbi:MAG: MFS transporter [bacterium]